MPKIMLSTDIKEKCFSSCAVYVFVSSCYLHTDFEQVCPSFSTCGGCVYIL